jgi:aminoglycoside/choline kinase family phosphotransferase
LNDIRLNQLKKWLTQNSGLNEFEIASASADASFRRYFRVSDNLKTYIAMDAPPEKENSVPFVAIAKILFNAGINVPEIVNANFDSGFFLMSDLGNQQYLSALNEASYEKLYESAIESLLAIQQISEVQLKNIPDYDNKLLILEMELFYEWFIERHLGIQLDTNELKLLSEIFVLLSDSALAQKQVLVHRDYHSRNIMTNIIDSNNPGILDFQDAVIGPFTYDLVSLLRDCYISWPETKVIELALFYKNRAEQLKLIPEMKNEQFTKYFDLMGIQRHLKAIGIFSRLNYRDNKSSYLNDIPRTLNYIKIISAKYSELSEFNHFLRKINK